MQAEHKYASKAEAKRAKNDRRKAKKKAEKEQRRQALIADLPKPTQHALDRWRQRFRDDESFALAYGRSRPVGWSALNAAVVSAGLVFRMRRTSEFRYDRETGAVFAIDSDGAGGKELRTVIRLRLKIREGVQ